MAKNRTKSAGDIMRQYMRIEANGGSSSRLSRAYKAMRRYIGNIKSKKSYRNMRDQVSAADNIDKYMNNLGKARRIQYSRNSYMGISNG